MASTFAHDTAARPVRWSAAILGVTMMVGLSLLLAGSPPDATAQGVRARDGAVVELGQPASDADADDASRNVPQTQPGRRPAQPVDPVAQALRGRSLPELIDALGHPSREVRDAAMMRLLDAGEEALAPLADGVRRHNPEIRWRARRVRELVQWGVVSSMTEVIENFQAFRRYPAQQRAMQVRNWGSRYGSDASRFLRAICLRDPDPEVRQIAFETLARGGSSAEVLAELVQAVSQRDPSATWAWMQLAVRYLNGGELEKAEEALLQVLASQPRSFEALEGMAQIAAQRGELETQRRYLERALEVVPSDDARFDMTLTLADLLLREGERRDAFDRLEALEQGITSRPKRALRLIGFYAQRDERRAMDRVAEQCITLWRDQGGQPGMLEQLYEHRLRYQFDRTRYELDPVVRWLDELEPRTLPVVEGLLWQAWAARQNGRERAASLALLEIGTHVADPVDSLSALRRLARHWNDAYADGELRRAIAQVREIRAAWSSAEQELAVPTDRAAAAEQIAIGAERITSERGADTQLNRRIYLGLADRLAAESRLVDEGPHADRVRAAIVSAVESHVGNIAPLEDLLLGEIIIRRATLQAVIDEVLVQLEDWDSAAALLTEALVRVGDTSTGQLLMESGEGFAAVRLRAGLHEANGDWEAAIGEWERRIETTPDAVTVAGWVRALLHAGRADEAIARLTDPPVDLTRTQIAPLAMLLAARRGDAEVVQERGPELDAIVDGPERAAVRVARARTARNAGSRSLAISLARSALADVAQDPREDRGELQAALELLLQLGASQQATTWLDEAERYIFDDAPARLEVIVEAKEIVLPIGPFPDHVVEAPVARRRYIAAAARASATESAAAQYARADTLDPAVRAARQTEALARALVAWTEADRLATLDTHAREVEAAYTRLAGRSGVTAAAIDQLARELAGTFGPSIVRGAAPTSLRHTRMTDLWRLARLRLLHGDWDAAGAIIGTCIDHYLRHDLAAGDALRPDRYRTVRDYRQDRSIDWAALYAAEALAAPTPDRLRQATSWLERTGAAYPRDLRVALLQTKIAMAAASLEAGAGIVTDEEVAAAEDALATEDLLRLDDLRALVHWCVMRGWFDDAARWAEHAITLDPADASAVGDLLEYLGRIRFHQAMQAATATGTLPEESAQAAIDAWDRMARRYALQEVTIDEDNGADTIYVARAAYLRARLAWQAGDPSAALTLADTAMTLGYRPLEFRARYARWLAEEGRYAEAEQVARTAYAEAVAWSEVRPHDDRYRRLADELQALPAVELPSLWDAEEPAE